MKIGDKVLKVPECLYGDDSWAKNKKDKPKPHVGTVVYIHPKGRFYTLEFELAAGKIRESYLR